MSKDLKLGNHFLSQCNTSASTYQAFKQLLTQLQQESSRLEAHQTLKELLLIHDSTLDPIGFSKRHFFSFYNISLAQNQKLKLLQFPSTFTPEEWSFTFYEGLSRFPINEFTNKVITELGCGNGWVSIALAQRSPLSKIYGLDINPRAITCAQINVFLNGMDDSSSPIRDGSGRPLWDKVEFYHSDLLEALRERSIGLDLVIGCIPQVLAPDPDALLEIVTESASDQELYDLSNYTEAHGYIEDQFGLGLIAKATEEAVQVLHPNGRMIFNLGGRPGTKVLEGLFKRRGFTVKKIWSTRVVQAGDTEIDALVKIEKSSQHRFEFYMGPNAQESISAKTAQALLAAGGEISHSLSVYEASLPAHEQVANILRFLAKPEHKSLHEGLDLSSEDPEVYQERVNFLSHLASFLEDRSELPYGETQGHSSLRRSISLFLRSYFRCPVQSENIFIAPSRADVISNMIKVYGPQVILFDQKLLYAIQGDSGVGSLQNLFPQILESPQRVDLLKELIHRIRPDLVVTSLNKFENESPEFLRQLFIATKESSSRLVLDMSDYFDLSSQPTTNAALSLLSEQHLPSHVTLICGLVKNKVYADLHLCFTISENQPFFNDMIAAAELTYSRAPLFTQSYYHKIFDDLLTFHLADARGLGVVERQLQSDQNHSELSPVSPHVEKAFFHPAIARAKLSLNTATIRLDYGENILPIPRILQTSIYEAFVRSDISLTDSMVKDEIILYMQKIFKIFPKADTEVFQGSGVAPLFANTLEGICKQDSSLVFPSGSYGEFHATALFFDVPIINCETQESNFFKYSPKALHECLTGKKNPWIFLNAPCVNPTGALYSSAEIAEIIAIAKSHGAGIIFDATFAGLEFNPKNGNLDLDNLFDDSFPWIFLIGIAKLFAAGGLRFGAAVTNYPDLKEALFRSPYRPPHFTVAYAAKQLFQKLRLENPNLQASLGEQRHTLCKRAQQLEVMLKQSGWHVIEPQGGLFLIAKPIYFIGKNWQSAKSNEAYTIDSQNIAEILFKEKNLLINGSDWTGIPGYCRFVLSVEQEEFATSLTLLQEFYQEFKENEN